MPEFNISININSPPNIVHKAFIDPDNSVKWMNDLERFEVVKGKADEAGAIARLHYRQKNGSYIMGDRLEYCEPGRKYVSTVSGDAITARIETTINPTDSGTEIAIHWSGKGKLLPVKLMLFFMGGRLVKQAKAELEKFKNLTEAYGARFPDNA